MRCPHEYCGGVVDEYVDDRGGGSRYCLDGCGYYEELPEGTFKIKRERREPVTPMKRKRKFDGRDQ